MSDQVLADWLERRDDPERIAALLAACAADPALAARARALAAVDERLSLALAPERADFVNRMRAALAGERFAGRLGGTLRARRRERALWAVVALQAAALVALAVLPKPDRDMPDGMHLEVAAGEVVRHRQGRAESVRGRADVAAGARLRLPPGARADLVLGPASRLRWTAGSDIVLLPAGDGGFEPFLAVGDLSAEIAQRDLRQPLYLSTPHCRVRVTGTAFTLSAGPYRSQVAVAHGTVQVQDLQDGSIAAVGVGQRLTSSEALPGGPLRAVPLAGLLAGVATGRAAGCESGTVQIDDVLEGGRETVRLRFSGSWGWLQHQPSPPQDWSAAAGIRLAFRGRGEGTAHQVELVDARVHWVATVIDDVAGWRTWSIPWTAFRVRSLQPEDVTPPTSTPFRPRAVTGYGLLLSGAGTEEVSTADWTLLLP